MTRPRDSYFRRVLDAEEDFARLIEPDPLVGSKSCQELQPVVDRLLRSAWWKKRRPDVTKLKIEDAYSRSVCSTTTIQLEEPVTVVELLHAITHFLHPKDTAWHGPEYAKAMLDVTGKVLGLDERRRLAAIYKDHGVKTVQWSREAKDRAKQRHAENDLKALLEELRPAQEAK